MKNKHTSPWAWIPTLYFAQGLPYVAVMTISVIMYKRLGISNTELAFYTGWLNLPWVIKPLWRPKTTQSKKEGLPVLPGHGRNERYNRRQRMSRTRKLRGRA